MTQRQYKDGNFRKILIQKDRINKQLSQIQYDIDKFQNYQLQIYKGGNYYLQYDKDIKQNPLKIMRNMTQAQKIYSLSNSCSPAFKRLGLANKQLRIYNPQKFYKRKGKQSQSMYSSHIKSKTEQTYQQTQTDINS